MFCLGNVLHVSVSEVGSYPFEQMKKTDGLLKIITLSEERWHVKPRRESYVNVLPSDSVN